MSLKKAFDYLASFFRRKKQTIDKICSIEFFISDDKEYRFLCNWAEVDGLDTAKYLAKLLFAINSGYFNDSIIKTLLDNSSEDKEKAFIDDVVFTWKLMNKEWENAVDKEATESPLIKPSQAFLKIQ